MGLNDISTECEQMGHAFQDTNSTFAALRESTPADVSQVVADLKNFASDAASAEAQKMEERVKAASAKAEAALRDQFLKLETRVLADLPDGSGGEASGARSGSKASESQLLKKLTNRISDFESQVASQIQTLTQDVDKKVSFMGSRRPGGEEVPGVESLARDVDAVKYDVGELKDLLNGAKHDTDHVKRIVLACERDMEDFTAAMDAVNVDLDEMRARVDSTHSIITSRQRVEATVTAEISTMWGTCRRH